jgi:uncharacterized protein (UPF0248 family)
MSETFYGIKVNKNLIWDYSFKEEDYKTEDFFFWYISRVLNNGNSKDVKTIPLDIIKDNLSKLNLSQKVKYFWYWYFNIPKVGL